MIIHLDRDGPVVVAEVAELRLRCTGDSESAALEAVVERLRELEALEDEHDARLAAERLADSDRPVPWDIVKADLGL